MTHAKEGLTLKLDLVPKQLPDILDAVLDHRRPLQRQAPGEDAHIWRQAHGQEHLGAEDSRVADFCPLFEVGVVPKDFHRPGRMHGEES